MAADADGLPLMFEGVLALVGGGRVDAGLLRDLAERGVALVGADGGGDVIARAGLEPAAIVGDLDSLADRAGWEQRTRIVHLAEQVTIDFEKAVYATRAPVTLALGMTGRRFDHTLAGLHVLMRYARERAIILVDDDDIALGVSGPFRFMAALGERVSMLPLEPVRFRRSSGLLYALDGLTLAPGVRTGVSNQGRGEDVVIEPEDEGVWLLVLGRDRLWDLVQAILAEGWPQAR